MKLKQVTTEQTSTAMSLLKESAQWLKEIGSTQWSDVLAGEDKHGLAEAVERGDVFFFYNNDNQLVGMAAAWKKPTAWDQLLWGKFETHQEVCYLHRVIIRPIYRRNGYGEELLRELKHQFAQEVSALRLDCLASNQKLLQFYQENGFSNVGSSNDFNGNKFELFMCNIENQS